LITETMIPALDAASKDAGYLTVRFQPEAIDVNPGGAKLSFVGPKPKLWRTSNFRLEIDGLDCTKVSNIDSFSVKREASKTQFPNLAITLSEASAQTWSDWHESFVVNGNNDQSFEKSGALRFLAIDLKTELSRIDLNHLGIFRLARTMGGSSQVARVTGELYCEEMVLRQPGGS
jgi:hypothetical protein